MNRIVIIGGGIAGLAAAYYATKKDTNAQITLIESSDRWGGKIITDLDHPVVQSLLGKV